MRHLTWILAATMALSIFPLAGCGLSPSVDAKHQAQLDYDQNYLKAEKAREAAEVKLAAAQAKEKLLVAEAEANPLAHPIEAANLVVLTIKPWLIALAILSAVVTAVSFGLKFYLPTIAGAIFNVSWRIAAFSIAAACVLPLFPPALWLFLAGGITWIVYLLIRDKGNVDEVMQTVESEIENAKAAPATPAATYPAPPAAIATSTAK